MPRGGWRPRAGRKPNGPEVPLSVSRQVDILRKIKDEIKETGEDLSFEGDDVISFFIAVAKNPKLSLGVRIDAARAAAPYVRSRKASVEITGKDGGPLLIEQIANAALAAVAAEREEEKRKQALH